MLDDHHTALGRLERVLRSLWTFACSASRPSSPYLLILELGCKRRSGYDFEADVLFRTLRYSSNSFLLQVECVFVYRAATYKFRRMSPFALLVVEFPRHAAGQLHSPL